MLCMTSLTGPDVGLGLLLGKYMDDLMQVCSHNVFRLGLSAEKAPLFYSLQVAPFTPIYTHLSSFRTVSYQKGPA